MRLNVLIHWATIVLVTVAAVQDKEDIGSSVHQAQLPQTTAVDPTAQATWPPQDSEHDLALPGGLPLQERGLTRRQKKKPGKGKQTNSGGRNPNKSNQVTPRPPPAGGGLDLLPAIKDFDMATKLKMGGTSDGTRILSDKAMNAAKMPRVVKLKLGTYSFKPGKRFRARTQAAFDRAVLMIRHAAYIKTQSALRPISGEVDLTQLIQQTMGSVTNEILSAIGIKNTHWHMIGLGNGAVPDLALTTPTARGLKTLAIVEVKTTSSMPNKFFKTIMSEVKNGSFKMKLITDGAGNSVPTLFGSDDDSTKRAGRQKSTVLVEQVLAEMHSTGAMVGALTNLENWLLFQRTASGIEVSSVSGSMSGTGTISGKSRGLEIMLGMSMKAVGK